MNNFFREVRGFWPQAVYVIAMPVFFLAFSLVYNPFNILEYCRFGGLSQDSHLLIFTSIILVTMLLSRSLLVLVMRRHQLKWWRYVVWCIVEATACALFIALYVTLFKKGADTYFHVSSDCVKFIFLTLVFPYAFLSMWQVIHNKDADLEFKEAVSENSSMKFFDEHKRLKLTIDKSSVLCIKSEYNYLSIFYVDGGNVKNFLLRNSMKSQEENCAEHGILRCHRSYYVNPKHVKVLSRDAGGLSLAILDSPEPMSIPVSKQYYEALSSIL